MKSFTPWTRHHLYMGSFTNLSWRAWLEQGIPPSPLGGPPPSPFGGRDFDDDSSDDDDVNEVTPAVFRPVHGLGV